jgi:hypothetical protein
VAACWFVASIEVSARAASQPETDQPNFVIIMADDLSYRDLFPISAN